MIGCRYGRHGHDQPGGPRDVVVRVSDDQVQRLISYGYLALENKSTAAAAIGLDAWIADNLI
jgi:hypothetical protein